jgi:hypothetical protein
MTTLSDLIAGSAQPMKLSQVQTQAPVASNAELDVDPQTGLDKFGRTPEQRQAILQRAQGFEQQAADVQPFNGGNANERAWIGTGYGMVRAGQAINQAGLHIGGALGVVDPSTVQNYDQAVKAEARQFQQGPGSTFAGKVGEFVGQGTATAPLGAVAVPARGAGLLASAGRAALAGGASALAQPTEGGEGYAGQKAAQFGLGAAVGGGIPIAARGLMTAAESAIPSNVVQRVANVFSKRANAQPFAQESEALAQRTGIPFTPGQVSGAKMQTGLENLSRQSLFSADKAFEADTRTANAAINYINRTMDNISPGSVSAQGVGEKVQTTVRNVIKSIGENRAATAARQYGAIDKALGNRPVVRYDKTAETLRNILGEYEDVPGQAAAAIRKQLEGMLEDVSKKPAYTLSSAQKARTVYGKAARGSADIFKDVKTSEQARIAKRLFGAMTDDIETSAAALDTGPQFGPGLMTREQGDIIGRGGVADAWRKANENYRNYSQLIDATEASPLRRLVGDKVDVGDFMTVNKLPPEKVVSTLGTMTPSELGMVRNVMERSAPETWQEYKRLLVQNALDEAQTAAPSMGANALPFNANKFVSVLGGGKPAKIAQLKAVFTPQEYAQIDDAFQAMRRLGDKFGANYSGTAPANEVLGILRGGIRGTVNVASQTLGMRKIANVMLNANGRRALIELSRLPPQSRQAASLAGYIAALASGQGGADVGPNGQVQQGGGAEN